MDAGLSLYYLEINPLHRLSLFVLTEWIADEKLKEILPRFQVRVESNKTSGDNPRQVRLVCNID